MPTRTYATWYLQHIVGINNKCGIFQSNFSIWWNLMIHIAHMKSVVRNDSTNCRHRPPKKSVTKMRLHLITCRDVRRHKLVVKKMHTRYSLAHLRHFCKPQKRSCPRKGIKSRLEIQTYFFLRQRRKLSIICTSTTSSTLEARLI